MADNFAPPAGPPPPKAPEVPPGWTARWNEQYKEWFYVNLHTKQSQWDRPTEPALPPPPPEDGAPGGPPPGYAPRPGDPAPIDSKPNPYEPHDNKSSTPQPGGPGGPSNGLSEDERLARQLQAEEDQRNRGSHSPMPPGYALQQQQHQQSQSPFPDQLPQRPQERGKSGSFLGKLLGKAKTGGSSHGQPGGYGGYPPQQQQYGGYPAQQQYGGYPPQQGYYPPQQPGFGGYGGGPTGYPMQGGYGGGYGHPQAAGRRPGGGGGMGMAGGMALGAGAGLLGGALIANSINDHEHEAYAEGYNDGAAGDDFGGDDFGGDF
ncbi:ww domain containing protein [Colletotrichum musicola]|uniref:Ww domain containing protein n=1 Tax=Colletotrichum musicola TaxID=2175873 RepID=A0A8H6K7A1_9PEZI|nr:ww domain containing protein [Colletotrichum musicola]